ncbi:homoserine dehydrogenase [Bacillus pinisoli]|uniref:homoserine dehydrogenase n=1 Tax=Bacillus pinisoli TaxID=2901866 RepID=UPI001FF27A36|nr:homoserine dehydrogenase [Bacillus pinisoli]
MRTVKVALLGLGTVGQGVYDTINSHQAKLKEATGANVEVVGILVKNASKLRAIHPTVRVTTEIEEILAIDEIDIVFEAIVGIEPANSYIKRFIEKGCHVISANKELLAHKGNELTTLANQNGVTLAFEAAVAGGIPLLRTIIQLLQVNGILKLEAILNGTSNYILTKMRKEKADFNEVLKEAQALGYAEANPANDILGTDAFYKLMILSNLIHQQQPSWEEVEKQGVNKVSLQDLIVGEKLGLRLKLIASLERQQDIIQAGVKPVYVSSNHPLYNVEGVDNGIVITTDLVGTILLQGPGAGSKATASAMIEDLVYIKQNGQPTVGTGRASNQYGSEQKSESTSVWVAISEALHADHLKQNYTITSKLEQHQVQLLQRELLKTEDGYIVGDLLRGKEENILLFLQQLEQETLRFYPVSSTGLSLEQYEIEQPLIQTIK